MKMTCFKTDISLPRTLMRISILPPSTRIYMTQEVCTSNKIQIFTRILPNSLSLRGEISKMSASIVSCNVSGEYGDLFQSPYVTNITNFESSLEDILSPDQF